MGFRQARGGAVWLLAQQGIEAEVQADRGYDAQANRELLQSNR